MKYAFIYEINKLTNDWILIKVEIKSKEKINIFNQKVADFIPIACHYNDTTLLTKNADLVQTIEIQGFIDKNSDEQQRVLRDDVR